MEPEPASLSSRVLFVAPTQRDGEVTRRLLEAAGHACLLCDGLAQLAQEIDRGVGVILLTDAALADPEMAEVRSALAGQPAWSDVPTVVLTRDRDRGPTSALALPALSNVTLLDRPTSTRSMVSAIASALRGRRKQYQLRDHLLLQEQIKVALREADLRKDEFLATLAHELRNPLSVIRNAVQVLGRELDVERSQMMVSMVDRQSRLLVKLIDDLLEVSRIATGKVVLERERIDLRAVAEAALETGQTILQSSQHELQVVLPPGPVEVVGDASRLTQVIGNLVNNAAKYTPDGGRIRVEVTQTDAWAVVRVADTGVGIPRDMLPLVFEMFTQVNRSLDRAQGGLGIGLSLVRRLVELHGGTVRADSGGADQGSEFTVMIPLATRASPSASSDDDGSSGDESGTTRQLRILVIDDNVDGADSLALLLGSEGHQIRTEYSGAAGLSTADEFEPDVVFCDIGMPGIDGHRVAEELRAQRRHASTVLVAVTGWGTEEHKRRTREAGFDVHLTKPVTPEAVEKILAGV